MPGGFLFFTATSTRTSRAKPVRRLINSES